MIRRLSCVALWLLLLVAMLLSPGSVVADETCSTTWCWRLLPGSDPATYAYNNLWNTRAAKGSQSITVYDVGDTALWSTTWNWKRGQQYTVTSYASTVTGWHWGEPFEVPGAIPVRMDQLQAVKTTVNYDYLEDSACSGKRAIICRYDVAYDLWFHDQDPTGTGAAPKFELMVWLSYSRAALFVGYQSVIQPLPTIAGHRWNVFQTTSTNAVFVIADPVDVNGSELDLIEFINVAKTLNPGLSSWFLSSVEFGIEVYQGKGTFTVTGYDLTITPKP
jgi:glycosyl hydrolase family 12